MTITIPVFNLSQKEAIDYFSKVSHNKTLIALPSHKEIDKLLSKLTQNKVPVYLFEEDDTNDTVYFTQGFKELCDDNEAKEKILKRVGKNRWHLLSEFHRELHADPNCPYAKQSRNYKKILERPFSILITTITRLAFVKSSLYAKEIYVSLSDDYYLDYSLRPRKIGLQDTQVIFEEEEREVSGYRRMRMYGNQNSDDESSIGWGAVSQDGKIVIPSLVALIQLNAINSTVKLKLNIASRDAYLFPELLEEVEGFEYKNFGEEDNAIPRFIPLRAFSHSKRKLTSPSLLKRIMRFYELDELTQKVGKKEEGKILLIVNSKILSDLHKWKSIQLNESKELLSNQIKDEEINKNDWKEFVDFLNAFRDRLIQYNQDKPKVIMMVLNDIHKRKLSKNPWNRIIIREGKFALYDEMDHYDSIIIYGRPDLFTQAVRSFAEGDIIDTYSSKSERIIYKTHESMIYGRYFKLLKGFANRLTNGNVYIADPQFDFGIEKYPHLLENNLEAISPSSHNMKSH